MASFKHPMPEPRLHYRQRLPVLFRNLKGDVSGREIEVTVGFTGPVLEPQGWILSRDELQGWVQDKLVRVYAKKNVSDLTGQNEPAAISERIFQSLLDVPKGRKLVQVTLKWDNQTQFIFS